MPSLISLAPKFSRCWRALARVMRRPFSGSWSVAGPLARHLAHSCSGSFCRARVRSCPPGLDEPRASNHAYSDDTGLIHLYSAQGFLVDSLDPRVPWRLFWSHLLVGTPPGRLLREFVNAAPDYVLGWLNVGAQVPSDGGRARRRSADPSGPLRQSPPGGAGGEHTLSSNSEWFYR